MKQENGQLKNCIGYEMNNMDMVECDLKKVIKVVKELVIKITE